MAYTARDPYDRTAAPHAPGLGSPATSPGTRTAYGAEPYRAGNPPAASHDRRGMREALLGILGLFAILGLVLGILAFASAFALDRAAEQASDGTRDNDALAGLNVIPTLVVSLLPFVAIPILALGIGSWAGHYTRNARDGGIAGAIGNFLGPILALLIMGLGFALGAGTSGLDADNVNMPFGLGYTPGWADVVPWLFGGIGLLWLLVNALSGGLSGGLIGGLMERRPWVDRWAQRRAHTRRRGQPRL